MEYRHDIEPLRRWNRRSIAAASVLLLLTVASLVLPAPRACGALASNYKPLIAFELARSVDDLQVIFGDRPSACRAELVAALDRVNVVDVVVFIPAYALFLCAWLIARREVTPRVARVGVALSIVAACGDLLENVCLFSLVSRIDAPSAYLSLLPWATAIKWLGLAVVAGLVGWLLVRSRPARPIAAIASVPAIVLTALATASPSRWGYSIATGITLSWVAMLVVAISDEARARRSEK